jgi:small subunit ribosomal protein S7
MSRRRRVIHKEVKKDARYASPVVASLISTVMRAGKKSTAERIVYTAIEKTREGTDTIDPLETLNKALENVKPRLEVKSRQVSLAMRWLVNFANGRKGVPMENALAYELKDAAAGQGNAIKKRDDMHKMAQANRAFAHFRW